MPRHTDIETQSTVLRSCNPLKQKLRRRTPGVTLFHVPYRDISPGIAFLRILTHPGRVSPVKTSLPVTSIVCHLAAIRVFLSGLSLHIASDMNDIHHISAVLGVARLI